MEVELRKYPVAKVKFDDSIKADDVFEIVFSSGSTGDPKGILLTHKNVCANLRSLSKMLSFPKNYRLLSIVPLSHMLEQTGGLLCPMTWGVSVVYPYAVKPKVIANILREQKITLILAVPAFLQLLRNTIERTAKQTGKSRQLNAAMATASKLSKSARRLLFKQVRNQLGRHVTEVYIGGAHLDYGLENFWNNLGISVYQGYGLTEASPLISVNTRKNNRAYSVGKILPGVKAKLTEEGEILVKGDNISQGYLNDKANTKSTFKDGWLHTGDIGKIDKDGYLYIVGRKKNVIVGPSGMNIYPEDIERVVREEAGVKDVVVHGLEHDSDIVITAVVLKSDNKPKDIIEIANRRLASHQKIQKVIVWPDDDFPRTPTRKTLRNEVIEKSQQTVDVKGKTAASPISHRLIEILAEVSKLPVEKIKQNSNIVDDLGLDSIRRLELVSKIEDTMGIEVSETAINYGVKVRDLIKLVDSQPSATIVKVPKWNNLYPVVTLRLVLQGVVFTAFRIFQKVNTDGDKLDFVGGPYILIANHQSNLDAPSIVKSLPVSARRQLAVAAAKDYFYENKLTAFLSRLMFNAFPLDRKGNLNESLTYFGKALDKGQSILIFPEGTRTLTGEMNEFRKGIGIIAKEMGTPIVPVKISGNYEIFPKGSAFPKKIGKTTVKFGKPIHVSRYDTHDAITDELEKILKEL